MILGGDPCRRNTVTSCNNHTLLADKFWLVVKNGFSNSTKVQDGQDQHRNNINKSDLLKQALKEGCHERESPQMNMSSTEKMDTKRDLTRLLSQTQTVTMGH